MANSLYLAAALNTNIFLVVPKRYVKKYLHQRDRDFFSVPIQVRFNRTCLKTGTLYVESPLQGGVTYPVDSKTIKHEGQLSNKQRDESRTI